MVFGSAFASAPSKQTIWLQARSTWASLNRHVSRAIVAVPAVRPPNSHGCQYWFSPGISWNQLDPPGWRIKLVPADPGTEPVLAPVAVGRPGRRHSHDRP